MPSYYTSNPDTREVYIFLPEHSSSGRIQVNIVLEGLGEIPEIQSIYLCHLKEAIEHPLEDALTKKSKSILNSL